MLANLYNIFSSADLKGYLDLVCDDDEKISDPSDPDKDVDENSDEDEDDDEAVE